ncbi:MAG: hypothetical protein GY810_15580 [Aureispira sp.]|nr:hypothetical protein [Aureispira sp.]
MQLYQQQDIGNVVWQDSAEHKMLAAFLKNGARHYIHNTDCQLSLLVDKNLYLPIVIPHVDYPNSYVCSPYGQYVDYGYKEVDIELSERPWANKLSKGAIKLFEKCAPRKYFDKVVFVNNWLLSTNLYTDISIQQLKDITDLLVSKYPDRAIVFRSVGDMLNHQLLSDLEYLNYDKVLSRQIYILDPKLGVYKKKKAYKDDLRLQRKRTDYQWVSSKDCTSDVWKRVKRFYDDLYLRKYSILNPQFSNAFFRDSIQEKWLNYHFLQKDGEVHACIAYFHRNGIMTTPILGYNFDLPKTEGFYRLDSLKIIQEGVQNNLIIHNSSGAAKYKKHRGAVPSSEYNLVYTKHLSRARKFPWKLLQGMTKHIATPILNRYEL